MNTIIVTTVLGIAMTSSAGGGLFRPGRCRLCVKHVLLLVVVNFVRDTLVYLKSLFFLNVRYGRPMVFMLANVFADFICIGLVCTLAISFKSVNGTVTIILVMVRITKDNKAFPVRYTPGFFRIICPLLPFARDVGTVHRYVTKFCKAACTARLNGLTVFLTPSLLLNLLLEGPVVGVGSTFVRGLRDARLVWYGNLGCVAAGGPWGVAIGNSILKILLLFRVVFCHLLCLL